MQNDKEQPASAEAIIKRAAQLSSQSIEPDLSQAEILAAISDGTLAIEDVEETVLERCIETFGAEAVAEAFQDGARRGAEAQRAFQPVTTNVVPFPRRWVPSRWMATAASLLLIAGISWIVTRSTAVPATNLPGDDRVDVPSPTPGDSGPVKLTTKEFGQTPWWRWTSALTFGGQDVWSAPVIPRVEEMPTPFDSLTAGVSGVVLLNPLFLDLDQNGRAEALVYRFATQTADASGPVDGVTVFIDFDGRTAASDTTREAKIPYGLWGIGEKGTFYFDSFFTLGANGFVAAGYTNAQGVVDDVRTGQSSDVASSWWRLNNNAEWAASQPSTPLPLLDVSRLGSGNEQQVRDLINAALGR